MAEKARLSIGNALKAVGGRNKTVIIAGCAAIVLVAALCFAAIAKNQPIQLSDRNDAVAPSHASSGNSADDTYDVAASSDDGQSGSIAGSGNSTPTDQGNATNPNSDTSGSRESSTSDGKTAEETHSDSAMDPSASSRPSTSQKTWVEDAEKVWVVDKEAWTEVIPVYENVEKSICNICGADITGNTSAHNKQHMLAGEGSGYHGEIQRIKVGERVIDHPEEGHWE